MNRTLLTVIGTIVSLFVLGIVFFIGLCCGVSLESNSADQSAAETSSSTSVTNSGAALNQSGNQNTIDNQASAPNSLETVINNNGFSTGVVNGLSGVIQNGTGACINDVCYDLAGPSQTINVTSHGIQMISGKHTLSISAGRLRVDGTDYGRAPTHGRVKITAGGRVLVNGTVRQG